MNTVRMPGSDVLHLVAGKLVPDQRFGGRHLVGEAISLCEKRGSEWIADRRGEDCPKCHAALTPESG